MIRFTEIRKETGVDLANQFMVVGYRGLNLLALHDAKHATFNYDSSKLEVTQLTRQMAGRVLQSLHDQFNSWNLEDEDSAKDYLGAVNAFLNFGVHSRLLQLNGKLPGNAPLTVADGRSQLRLDVAVVTPVNVTIAFRFVELRDDSGNTSPTEWGVSNANWLISKLNWIYGPQANVTFELAEAEAITVNVKQDEVDVTKPLTGESFLKFVAGQKSRRADWTMFLVHKFISVDRRGFGQTFSSERVCVVEDNPALPVTEGSDPFLVNFAHEIAHALMFVEDPSSANRDDHHNRPNVLLSRDIQSSKVDKKLFAKINPA